MDESAEVNVSNSISETSNMAAVSSILRVIKRFIGAFVLTDEEKLEAGIDSDNNHERHDARLNGEPDLSDGFRAKGRIG
jgi:hypothetical protein